MAGLELPWCYSPGSAEEEAEDSESGLLCLGFCPHDPAPDRRKKMNGGMDGWMNMPLDGRIPDRALVRNLVMF